MIRLNQKQNQKTKIIVQILVSIGANVIIKKYSTEKTIKIKTVIYKTTINNAL